MNNMTSILWGVVLVLLGVLVGTNSLGITNIDIFFDGWWSLFIIIPCFIGLFSNEDKTGNIIGLLVGVILLLGMNDILDLDKIWKLIVPSIIVIIGLSLIFKNSFNSKVNDKINKLNKEKNSDDNYFADFSGQDVNLSYKKVNGSDVTVFFGGFKLDLREAIIEKDIVINASSIFGGINILVTEDVNVIVKSTSIFRGFTNKKENSNSKKNIYINAMCMFGGVDIK